MAEEAAVAPHGAPAHMTARARHSINRLLVDSHNGAVVSYQRLPVIAEPPQRVGFAGRERYDEDRHEPAAHTVVRCYAVVGHDVTRAIDGTREAHVAHGGACRRGVLQQCVDAECTAVGLATCHGQRGDVPVGMAVKSQRRCHQGAVGQHRRIDHRPDGVEGLPLGAVCRQWENHRANGTVGLAVANPRLAVVAAACDVESHEEFFAGLQVKVGDAHGHFVALTTAHSHRQIASDDIGTQVGIYSVFERIGAERSEVIAVTDEELTLVLGDLGEANLEGAVELLDLGKHDTTQRPCGDEAALELAVRCDKAPQVAEVGEGGGIGRGEHQERTLAALG